jgi:hypothetical protein
VDREITKYLVSASADHFLTCGCWFIRDRENKENRFGADNSEKSLTEPIFVIPEMN